MRIVASVEARMHSSRLPGKVLKDICGKPVLWHIVERLKRAERVQDIVIATTVNPKDDQIVEFADKLGVKIFRGSEEDVLHRLVDAHKMMKSDTIVEITGDSPLIDPEIVDQTIELYLNNDADYVSNTLTRSYPIGIRTQVFSLDLLSRCEKESYLPKDREHVTTHICKNPDKFKLLNLEAPASQNFPKLRLTLDYEEDLNVIRKIYEGLYFEKPNFLLRDVLHFLSDHPDIPEINRHCRQIHKAGA